MEVNRLHAQIVGLILLTIAPALHAAQPFRIDVVREYEIGQGVFGTLFLNGERIGATVEAKRTLIPEGSFPGDMRYHEIEKSHVLGLDQGQVVQGKDGDFLIQLRGAPGGHTAVQIHVGNWPTQSTACILVGKDVALVYDQATKTRAPGVRGSLAQLISLRTAFYGTANPVASPHKAIVVMTSKTPGYRTYPDWQARVREVTARMTPGPIPSTSSPKDRTQTSVLTTAPAKSRSNEKDVNDGPKHDSIAETRGQRSSGGSNTAGNAGNAGSHGTSASTEGHVIVRDTKTHDVKSADTIPEEHVTGQTGNQ